MADALSHVNASRLIRLRDGVGGVPVHLYVRSFDEEESCPEELPNGSDERMAKLAQFVTHACCEDPGRQTGRACQTFWMGPDYDLAWIQMQRISETATGNIKSFLLALDPW